LDESPRLRTGNRVSEVHAHADRVANPFAGNVGEGTSTHRVSRRDRPLWCGFRRCMSHAALLDLIASMSARLKSQTPLNPPGAVTATSSWPDATMRCTVLEDLPKSRAASAVPMRFC